MSSNRRPFLKQASAAMLGSMIAAPWMTLAQEANAKKIKVTGCTQPAKSKPEHSAAGSTMASIVSQPFGQATFSMAR